MNNVNTKNDTISRQAAIDALNKLDVSDGVGISSIACDLQEEAIRSIEDLPSAQHEIIRCNSCKHWTQTTGKMKGYGLGRCDYLNADLVTCNGFCYWAERRNDG